MTTAARTELPAAERFSERIKSDEENAELPDMQELSPLRVESAKQIAAANGSLQSCTASSSDEAAGGKRRALVLGFVAGQFHLSDAPILEEMTYV